MSLVPSPLHPAVVHFPIVLLLLGAVFAITAVFWRKHGIPALAAGLLVVGAFGTWAAVETGESVGGLVENTSDQISKLVDAHETWAKRTLTISFLAGFAAGGAVLTGRWPGISRALAIVAALFSVAAAYGVYETGHRGGSLVYRYGAGVEFSTTAAAGSDALRESVHRREVD